MASDWPCGLRGLPELTGVVPVYDLGRWGRDEDGNGEARCRGYGDELRPTFPRGDGSVEVKHDHGGNGCTSGTMGREEPTCWLLQVVYG